MKSLKFLYVNSNFISWLLILKLVLEKEILNDIYIDYASYLLKGYLITNYLTNLAWIINYRPDFIYVICEN